MDSEQNIKAVVLLTKQDLYWQLFYHLKRKFIYRATLTLAFSALIVYITENTQPAIIAIIILASIFRY